MKPLYKWLNKQPKEFVDEFNKMEMYGDGHFTIQDLIELDLKYNNPEGEDD